mgnify:FL=1
MFNQYEFQTKAEDDICSLLEKHKTEEQDNLLICIPTGGGKTVISGNGFKKFLDNNKDEKILFLVPLQCLVSQTYNTLKAIGIDVSVFHNTIKKDIDGNNFKMGLDSQVIISMPETFQNDLALEDSERTIPDSFVPYAIAMDEAHRMTSDMNQMIKFKYQDALVIGFTATPFRSQNKEGEHLTEWYGNNLKQYVTVAELIELGRLVQPYYYEFDDSDSVFDNWKLLADKEDKDKRSTVIFTSNTDQSLKLKEVFLKNNITAEIITAGSKVVPGVVVKSQTHAERNEIYRKFRDREITVLISVDALCEGWDEPSANICLITRRVISMSIWQQMIGRVLRAFKDKEYALVLDFGENFERFGPIEDIVWELGDPKEKTITAKQGKDISEKVFLGARKIFTRCECNHVFDIKKYDSCPACHKISTVKVVEKLGDIIKDKMPDFKLDNSTLKNMIVRVTSARNYPDIKYRLKVNEAYSTEIFDENGLYTDKFKFIEKLNSHTVKLSTKVILN